MPMLDLLKTGFFHLETEETELKARAKQKEEKGSVSRHKQSGKSMVNANTFFNNQCYHFPPYVVTSLAGIISSIDE